MTAEPEILMQCRQAAQALPTLFSAWQVPEIFLQLGPGFQPIGLFDGTPQAIPLSSLPGMPAAPTPDGIHPELLFGLCHGQPLLAQVGHRHLAESLGLAPCLLPCASACLCGCRRLILASCGLSLRQDIKAGTWTLLTDFLNWHHLSPLDGLSPLFPQAYPDMTQALSQEFNSEIVNSFSEVGVHPRLVTYLSFPGHHFCTYAEASLLRTLGADIYGHDLVMEIMLGHALGAQVSALVLAGGQMLDGLPHRLTRQELLDTADFCSRDLMRGIRKMLNS
jgi:purine nucleoside phosphorylase